MSTRIEVQPDVADEIAARARADGMSVDAYLRILLTHAGTRIGVSPPAERPSLDDFKAMLDSLKGDAEVAPSKYWGTYSREDIYFEHD